MLVVAVYGAGIRNRTAAAVRAAPRLATSSADSQRRCRARSRPTMLGVALRTAGTAGAGAVAGGGACSRRGPCLVLLASTGGIASSPAVQGLSARRRILLAVRGH